MQLFPHSWWPEKENVAGAVNIIFDYKVTLKLNGVHGKTIAKKRGIGGFIIKLTQQLRAIAALAEGGSSVPRSRAHKLLKVLFWTLSIPGTHVCTCTLPPHTSVKEIFKQLFIYLEKQRRRLIWHLGTTLMKETFLFCVSSLCFFPEPKSLISRLWMYISVHCPSHYRVPFYLFCF